MCHFQQALKLFNCEAKLQTGWKIWCFSVDLSPLRYLRNVLTQTVGNEEILLKYKVLNTFAHLCYYSINVACQNVIFKL